MTTMNVLDSVGATVAIEKPLAPGRAAAALSRPVALSNEDAAFLDGIEANQTSQITQETAINTVLGVKGDAKSTATDTTAVSAVSVWKQISASVQALVTAFGAALTRGAGAVDSNTQRVAIASDSAGVMPQFTADQASNAAGIVTRIPPQEVHLGEVGGKTIVFPLTPTLDTSAYAAGDVLFDRTVLTNLFRVNDGTGILQSIQVVDQDDNGVAIDFYLHTTNQTLGTANAAPSISDANAVELLGPFSIAAADYKDLGGVKVGKIASIGQPIKAVSGGKDFYISAVVSAGTPTFTAAGIKLRLGVLLD